MAAAPPTVRQPPLIAIVGSDGSGKSTVGADLLAWMRERQPTKLCHLGKQTGNIGRAIARWPLVGRRMDRALTAKARGAQGTRGPGVFTALVIYAFSMRRVRRFRRMLALRQGGFAILTDRFPQIAVPGPMDGLALASAPPRSRFVRILSRREWAHYEWMAGHAPDLVLRLNVDLATAIARKPDHRLSSLRTKVADVPRLTFGDAPIVDIDATLPLPEVIAHARRAIADLLAHRAA